MFSIKPKKITKVKKLNKKFKRIYTDAERINITHTAFMRSLRKMPKSQRRSIMAQMKEMHRDLLRLEKAERDPSPFPTEEQYQQQFFEQTDW